MKFRPLFLACAALALAGAADAAAALQSFPDSIAAVPTAAAAGPSIVRLGLSADEAAAPFTFAVNLRMRDLAGLQARLAAGGQVSPAEMEAEYLPLASDYNRVAAWMTGAGFTTVLTDPNHTTLVVQGSAALVAQALGVTLARVAVPATASSPAAEYTSAITAPSLPDAIAVPVLGFDGLQPHLRPRHVPVRALPQDNIGGFSYVTPDDVAAAYNMTSTWTGKGQTIAIVDEATASNGDLTSFWSTVGVSQTAANVTVINVGGGGVAPSGSSSETALDVEWAGALAPAAQIRLYVAPSNALLGLTQVLSDLRTNSSISVVSVSYGAPESGPASTYISIAQTMAQLAAAGVSVFVSSGDGGSNPSSTSGTYGAGNPTVPDYPASDPSVTGVGGTTLAFNSNYVETGETTWNFISSQGVASGGGISIIFAAPSWQTGTPSATRRCVPDVAAIAAGSLSTGNLGAYIYVSGASSNVIGTSLACPVWAAVGAQINQARVAAGLGTAGLLGPRIYPLAGTNAFTDITTGSNGAYSAAAGYDLCTGLGSPNVKNLIQALGGVLPPTITAQPQSVAVATGAAFSFGVTATGGGTLAYQWSLNGAAVAGATAATFSKASSTAADAGSYTVTVSNSGGSTTSAAVTLTEIAPPAITSQPVSVTTTIGTLFQFNVTATGGGSLSYQWLLNGSAIAGATGTSYVKGAAAATDAGSYTVVVTNAVGSVTSSAATLTIASTAAASSGGGGGGGGGAPSLWFYGALILAGLARQATRRPAV